MIVTHLFVASPRSLLYNLLQSPPYSAVVASLRKSVTRKVCWPPRQTPHRDLSTTISAVLRGGHLSPEVCNQESLSKPLAKLRLDLALLLGQEMLETELFRHWIKFETGAALWMAKATTQQFAVRWCICWSVVRNHIVTALNVLSLWQNVCHYAEMNVTLSKLLSQ